MEITNLSKDKNNLLERIFKLQKHAAILLFLLNPNRDPAIISSCSRSLTELKSVQNKPNNQNRLFQEFLFY